RRSPLLPVPLTPRAQLRRGRAGGGYQRAGLPAACRIAESTAMAPYSRPPSGKLRAQTARTPNTRTVGRKTSVMIAHPAAPIVARGTRQPAATAGVTA